MSLTGIAARAGTNVSQLEDLINQGNGSAGFAGRIGTNTSNITEFIGGKASPGIAAALGTTTDGAQELRDLIGREGAIGLIVGLACGLDQAKV